MPWPWLPTSPHSARTQLPTWLQIKADVLGVEVSKPTGGHGPAQGAAALAGIAIGSYESFEDVEALAAEVEATYRPHPSVSARYSDAAARFAALSRVNTGRILD